MDAVTPADWLDTYMPTRFIDAGDVLHLRDQLRGLAPGWPKANPDMTTQAGLDEYARKMTMTAGHPATEAVTVDHASLLAWIQYEYEDADTDEEDE